MITLERGKIDTPIRLTLKLAGVGVDGLTSSDLTVVAYNAAGTLGALTGFDLTEIDPAFPGVYLMTAYGDDLTLVTGPAGIKVTGVLFDPFIEEILVSEESEFLRKLYQLSYFNLVWSSDESRWELRDAADLLLGWFPAEDVNANPAVIDGTHPVTRLMFVPAP